MNNDKRQMLEGLYITGNKYLYSKEVQEMMHHHLNRINKHFKMQEFGGHHYTYFYRARSILSYYEGQLGLSSAHLRSTKENANKIFMEYMDLKKEIVESGAYADPEIRKLFNKKKDEWRAISMDVLKAKVARYSCEIDYNSIAEYVNSTTEYIKFLEQNQKEKV